MQRVERCDLEGNPVLTFSSQEIRAELLGMGYREADLSELEIRSILRGLLGFGGCSSRTSP